MCSDTIVKIVLSLKDFRFSMVKLIDKYLPESTTRSRPRPVFTTHNSRLMEHHGLSREGMWMHGECRCRETEPVRLRRPTTHSA